MVCLFIALVEVSVLGLNPRVAKEKGEQSARAGRSLEYSIYAQN